METHPYEKAFYFNFRDDETEHYHVPGKTTNNLFCALMELETANNIIDIMGKSQNNPAKRLIASIRYAQQLVSDLPGLSSEDREKLAEAQKLIDFCESAEDILRNPDEENYMGIIARAAYCLTDIMQHVFTSAEDVQKTYDFTLFVHHMYWCNPDFQHIWDNIK